MKPYIFLLLNFICTVTLAQSDFSKNRKCIQTIDRLDLLPEGLTLVPLSNGGIIVIEPGPENSFFVTNNKPAAANSHGLFPSHKITTKGACSMISRTSNDGAVSASSALTGLYQKKDLAKANEVLAACQDAPAFKDKILEIKGYHQNPSTSDTALRGQN